MSKSKKNKNTQVSLSPENYIRKRSRSIPIVKCLITEDWENKGIAHIFVVRQHASGNITFCGYFADTYCLGIKDSFFMYNVEEEYLDECVKEFDLVEVSYDIVHNVIFAALTFAEEYGFKPHRSFSSITQHFLEDDDENIPLIDVHCGNEDGDPLYFNCGDESPEQVEKIIRQLEKKAGKGNFGVVTINADDDDDDLGPLGLDFDFENFDYNEWNPDDYRKALVNMSLQDLEEEACSVFTEYAANLADGECDWETMKQAEIAADVWIERNNLVNPKLLNEYLEMMKTDMASVGIDESRNVPNSLFPDLAAGGQEPESDYANAFKMIFDSEQDGSNAKEQISRFEEKYGECGASVYLKYAFNVYSDVKTYRNIEQKFKQFHDYFLVKLTQKDRELVKLSLDGEEARKQLMALVEGKTLTRFEMMEFIMCYTIRVFDLLDYKTDNSLEKSTALLEFLEGGYLNYFDYTTEKMKSFARKKRMDMAITKLMLEEI